MSGRPKMEETIFKNPLSISGRSFATSLNVNVLFSMLKISPKVLSDDEEFKSSLINFDEILISGKLFNTNVGFNTNLFNLKSQELTTDIT